MIDRVVIVDMQFGSTGKGQIAGTLAHVLNPETAVTAWAPNAGHTFRKGDAKYVHTMLASSAVAPSVKNILIGPGSVLNVQALQKEIIAAGPMIMGKHLIIHPNAALLLPHHSENEQKYVRIGSTMKGSAAAVMQKMDRDPENGNIARERIAETMMALSGLGVQVSIDEDTYRKAIKHTRGMVVEGAQGTGLSIHSRFYPYCTSRDVSVNQILADCRLPHMDYSVIGVCRTYPIRVANRFDAEGKQIGTSGGHYPDQQELDWRSDLGREPELTTVTKLPRRIFSFSIQQIVEAVEINRPDVLALTFCDYLTPTIPAIGNPIPIEVMNLIHLIENATRIRVGLLSFGPDTTDVFQVNPDTYVLEAIDHDCLCPF